MWDCVHLLYLHGDCRHIMHQHGRLAQPCKQCATVTADLAAVTISAMHVLFGRCLGSCALDMCSVASGRLDAMYEIGFGG